ncbi:sigma factor [Pseudoflavitalea rhizosphaerae]|uniref:sigma factor n=1 Tax=Pseudoflavitalea rhizosphaerae TaxID=1884793 RepID=UPI000F8D1A71|nr:sigma factor [Pseudoflavitalea rhizosphaerae]
MSHRNSNTDEIVQQFRSGNTDTFAIIFHQFYLEIIFFAKQILDKPREAERIVENTFIGLWKSHMQFENWKAIKAYLYKNVRDACFGMIEIGQKGIKDDGLSVYVWRDATQFMEKELSRPGPWRELSYNPAENLPPLAKEYFQQLRQEKSKN